MAGNFVEKGEKMSLPTLSGAQAEDPMVLGDNTPVVLLTDAETTSPYRASCALEGVYDLSVKGHNGVGNVAIDQFDKVYYTAGRTPVLDVDNTGKPFGIMMSETQVSAGATATRKIKLIPNMETLSES